MDFNFTISFHLVFIHVTQFWFKYTPISLSTNTHHCRCLFPNIWWYVCSTHTCKYKQGSVICMYEMRLKGNYSQSTLTQPMFNLNFFFYLLRFTTWSHYLFLFLFFFFFSLVFDLLPSFAICMEIINIQIQLPARTYICMYIYIHSIVYLYVCACVARIICDDFICQLHDSVEVYEIVVNYVPIRECVAEEVVEYVIKCYTPDYIFRNTFNFYRF